MPYQLTKRFSRARQTLMTPRRRIQFVFNRPTVRGRVGKYGPLIDKGMKDDSSSITSISVSGPWSSFILMPALGQAQGERHTHVFKTWSLHIKRGFHIATNPQSLGELVFVDFLLVLDRSPIGATIPAYDTIFPPLSTTPTDQDCGLHSFMRPEAMSRFKLIRRVRIDLNTIRTYGACVNRKSFELYVRFKGSKSIYSQMRDDNGSVHGMYSNCKKNAFLMYAIMHSDNRITVDDNINVRRIFYH
ncbi:hypothetical protein U1Q18_002146 [Sarracenia purpurea var. burkii]